MMDFNAIAELWKAFPVLNFGAISVFLIAWLRNRLETRKQISAENSGLRKEFIDEMSDLRTELRGMRDENGKLRDEVRGLRAENDNLRLEVRQLHGVIDGLRRETQGAAISAQRIIAEGRGDLTPEMQAAVRKLDEIHPPAPKVVGHKSEGGA